jgi:hypothetical protein
MATTLGERTHHHVHVVLDVAPTSSYPLPLSPAQPQGPRRWDEVAGAAADRNAENQRRAYKLLERVRSGLGVVELYDYHAAWAIVSACLSREARLLPGTLARHEGPGYERAVVELFGGDDQMFTRRVAGAWDLLAWLIARPEVRQDNEPPPRIKRWLEKHGVRA